MCLDLIVTQLLSFCRSKTPFCAVYDEKVSSLCYCLPVETKLISVQFTIGKCSHHVSLSVDAKLLSAQLSLRVLSFCPYLSVEAKLFCAAKAEKVSSLCYCLSVA